MSIIASELAADRSSVLSRILRSLAQVEKSVWLPLVVIFALVVFFSLASDAFFTVRNFTAISAQAGTLLIVCLGATFVVLTGSIDLSIGAIVLLVGAASVIVLNATGIGLGIIIFAAMLGSALGTVNGLVYVFGRIPSFVVTLGTLSIFSGIALQLLDGRALGYTDMSIEAISIGLIVPKLPNIALWALIAWVIAVLVSQRTRFGRYMYIIGGGEAVARTSGIPVDKYKVLAFAVSGLLAGIGAILAVARLGATGPSLGSDLLLSSLAAVVVGGTSLAGGIGGPQRTLIGVLIIAILDNGLNLMGVSQYFQMVIKGAVVVAAVLITQGRQAHAVIK